MGAEEEVLVTLSGGAPWGFRLQGGSEQKRPLQVSKVGLQVLTVQSNIIQLIPDIPGGSGIYCQEHSNFGNLKEEHRWDGPTVPWVG